MYIALLVLNTPSAWPFMKLHWPVRPSHFTPRLPGAQPHQTHQLPVATRYQAASPVLHLTWANIFGRQQPSAHAATLRPHIVGELFSAMLLMSAQGAVLLEQISGVYGPEVDNSWLTLL